MGADFSFTLLSGSRLLPHQSKDFYLVRAYEDALNLHHRNIATPGVAHCSITARSSPAEGQPIATARRWASAVIDK